MLINTKDGLQNGIEEGKVALSVFSVSNYSKSNNKASILRVNKDLNVVPYVIKGLNTKVNWIEGTFKPNHTFSEEEQEFRKTMF